MAGGEMEATMSEDAEDLAIKVVQSNFYPSPELCISLHIPPAKREAAALFISVENAKQLRDELNAAIAEIESGKRSS